MDEQMFFRMMDSSTGMTKNCYGMKCSSVGELNRIKHRCDKTRGIKWSEEVRGRYRSGRKGREERRDKCEREKV